MAALMHSYENRYPTLKGTVTNLIKIADLTFRTQQLTSASIFLGL